MGAYAYCARCEAPLGRPTLRELVLNKAEDCPHCGRHRDLWHRDEELADALEREFEDLAEQIAALTVRVERLEQAAEDYDEFA